MEGFREGGWGRYVISRRKGLFPGRWLSLRGIARVLPGRLPHLSSEGGEGPCGGLFGTDLMEKFLTDGLRLHF